MKSNKKRTRKQKKELDHYPLTPTKFLNSEFYQRVKVAEYLKRYRGFKDFKFEKRERMGCYDIEASKGKRKWLIEVKTGGAEGEAKIRIDNILRMLKERTGVVALAFVTDKSRTPIIFELDKMKYAD